MKLFLKLKAWQMFLLLMAPVFLSIFSSFLPFFFGPNWQHFTDSASGVIGWLWMAIGVGWFYSVGIASNHRLPPSLQKNPLIYRLGFAFAVAYGIVSYTRPQTPPSIHDVPPPVWMNLLDMLAVVGMFYGLWFTAKQFTTLQRQEKLRFYDYSGPFFMFWLYFIGVWFLQPKINALLGSDEAV